MFSTICAISPRGTHWLCFQQMVSATREGLFLNITYSVLLEDPRNRMPRQKFIYLWKFISFNIDVESCPIWLYKTLEYRAFRIMSRDIRPNFIFLGAMYKFMIYQLILRQWYTGIIRSKHAGVITSF